MFMAKQYSSGAGEAPEAAVLDLCVRRERGGLSPVQGYTHLGDNEEIGLDLCRREHPVRGYVSESRNSLQDTSYSGTMSLLQSRLYEDRRRSPYLSDESSIMTIQSSDSPPHHPVYIPVHPTPSYAVSPTHANNNIALTATTRAGKPTRPFKAYPKDPLSLVKTIAEGMSGDSDEAHAYAEFRKRMLDKLQASSGGITDNKNMKRPVQSISPSHQLPSSSMDPKDTAYWERRKKNNEAAKRSRDARRAKEDEIAIRAAFLEQENMKLKYEVATLRNETSRLRCMLFSN